MEFINLLAQTPALFIFAIILFSLMVGSFLNVVIHRLPLMLERDWREQATAILATEPSTTSAPPTATYNLLVPRSACPHCGTPITALQNIPVISYLWLRGQCARCGKKISARYPLIEISTALLSAVIAWQGGFTWYTLAALLFTWSLIALSVIDFDHQILPDQITLPLLWLGLLLSLTHKLTGFTWPVDPQSAILGATIGYLSLWCVFHIFKWLTGKEGLGYGDFKLLAAFGAWLGWQMLPLIILLSALTGSVIGIVLIVACGRDRNIPIPFGPYLAAAGWIALLWGQDMTASYLHLLGQ